MLRPKTREYQLYPLKPTAPDTGSDVLIDVASEVWVTSWRPSPRVSDVIVMLICLLCHLRRPYLLLAFTSIFFSAGSYLLVSGVSMIWTVLCSFVSAVLFLNKALAELMVRGITLFAILGFTAFMSGVLLFVTGSITVHDFICKFGRPKYVIMSNNRTHWNNDNNI